MSIKINNGGIMYIYITQNIINGKIYIGKSEKDVEKSTKYYGSGIMISKAINKYGKENFKKHIIKNNIESLEQLNSLEIYYIKLLNSQDTQIGYNIAPGGDGGDIYNCLSEERKLEVNKKKLQNMVYKTVCSILGIK